MTPDQRAERAAQTMWAADPASQWLGMQLGPVHEGHAQITLEVQAHHCNGHGTCHGGVIFSLADSAFAFACNSRNQRTVAQHCMVNYIAPSRAGDVLIAEASEVSLTGRSGIYDVTVRNQSGDLIATFRGMSRSIKGQVFETSEKGDSA